MRAWTGVLMCMMAIGCGGTSEVTDGAHTLKPRSAIAYNLPQAKVPSTGLLIADQSDLCETLPKQNACNDFVPTADDEVAILILVFANKAGTYDVHSSRSSSDQVGATFDFEAVEQGRFTLIDHAVSGSVTLSKVVDHGTASGSYDVTMASGAHLAGTFVGDDCPDLDKALLADSAISLSCRGEPSSDTRCSYTCTCQNRSAQIACVQGASGGWDCTCTSASGTTLNCTTPAASSSSAACLIDTCCPLQF